MKVCSLSSAQNVVICKINGCIRLHSGRRALVLRRGAVRLRSGSVCYLLIRATVDRFIITINIRKLLGFFVYGLIFQGIQSE